VLLPSRIHRCPRMPRTMSPGSPPPRCCSGDEVFVRVRDRRGGDDFVLNPRKHVALSAFHHPYALRPLDTSTYATPAARAQLEV
jgi:hypothetical protein